jgi:GT2 family glycosyltransferase
MPQSGSTPLVSIVIVSYNAERHVDRYMRSLAKQEFRDFEVVVVDNQSRDRTVELIRRYPDVQLIQNSVNSGSAGGNNQGIRAARGEWIFMSNLDTVLEPNFLTELVRASQLDESVGAVAPKILRMNRDGSIDTPPLIDSTGIYLTPWHRQHDRGSQTPDRGQYETPEYVFGYTGALALLRRKMIDDISINGQYCDEDFFSFREDSDTSWRMQLLGWKCLYQPRAVAYHERSVFEGNRDQTSALINMHSTKNRFLMRMANITWPLYLRTFFPATLRDIGIVAYVLLKERTSLPALPYVFKHWRRLWARRQVIQSRRRVTEAYMSSLCQFKPVAKPLNPGLLAQLEAEPKRVPLGPGKIAPIEPAIESSFLQDSVC